MENKWHDASACLPVEGTGSVLVIVSGMHNGVAYLYSMMIAEYVKGDGWIIEGREDWENADVLFWMPMPALLKRCRAGSRSC